MTALVLLLVACGVVVWSIGWGGRTARTVVGVLAIIGAVLWLPIWLFAVSWVGATADIRTWGVFCLLLMPSALILLAGVSLIRWRLPRSWGWLGWSVVFAVPLGLFLFVFEDNRGAARINSAVSRAFERNQQQSFVQIWTLCDFVGLKADGSEWWACEVEPYQEDVRMCDAAVRRRSLWRISVQLKGCRLREN